VQNLKFSLTLFYKRRVVTSPINLTQVISHNAGDLAVDPHSEHGPSSSAKYQTSARAHPSRRAAACGHYGKGEGEGEGK
jgi:hypothetical protein